jgi:hypothetical protein
MLKTGFFLLCFCASAAGQLITVDAGRGMSSEPSGGVIGVNFGNWKVEGSLATYNGTVVGGGSVEGHFNLHWSIKAGDQSIGVGIPTGTDLSLGVLARGAALSYAPDPATLITAFGGMAGSGYSSTSAIFFTPQIPLGYLSVDHYIDPKRKLLLFGRALFSNQQTILGGALYQSTKLKMGFAAGTGSNQPHVEGKFRYFDKQWNIHSGYLYSGSRFLLLTLPQFRIAQEDRENIDVRWNPRKEVSLTLGRHQYLEPLSAGTSNVTAKRGSTDTAGGVISIHRIGVGANVFESRFTGIYASAASFLVALHPTSMVQLSGNYYRPLHSSNPIPMLSLNAEERINRRLRLAEFATHVNQQWNVNYGGSLRWDCFDVNIGYATYFSPLAANGGRFKQQMNLSGHLHLGRWQFGIQTYVQPDGSMLYGYEVRSFYFHPIANGRVQAPQSRGASLPRFIVAGQVTLEVTGKPVVDVPIRIGDETVYTDENGVFILHVARKRTYKIQLLLERQIGFHYYEQVSGPIEVTSEMDESPGQAHFVVQVNQKKIPNLPKGGIVIGLANTSPDSASGGKQGSRDADGTGGKNLN